MFHSPQYLFTSRHLGFRNWSADDLDAMAVINADPEVMEFFPETNTREQTAAFIERMQEQFAAKGFCYFAVDVLDGNTFIGFIGISEKNFEADFTPCIDIGWRLQKSVWGRGYATEGAKRCLEYGLSLTSKIYAIAPVVNTKSVKVMEKIGMKKVKHFMHPLLEGNERLQECVLYEKVK